MIVIKMPQKLIVSTFRTKIVADIFIQYYTIFNLPSSINLCTLTDLLGKFHVSGSLFQPTGQHSLLILKTTTATLLFFRAW